MNPLLVALAVVVQNNSVLLIRRKNKGTYPNMLALPGGKIEFGEHISETCIREVKEETGLDTEFVTELGVVSELVHDGKEKHFVLHVCKLKPMSGEISEQDEGKPEWVKLNNLSSIKDEIIPSDYLMIHNFVEEPKKHYWESELVKKNDKLEIVRFD